ncbi:Nucleolar protein 12 [Nowakowskiella sp. JEL0078]|nr:Nucleolar protein 12 [Nowakowskiella sp. JEL0078]
MSFFPKSDISDSSLDSLFKASAEKHGATEILAKLSHSTKPVISGFVEGEEKKKLPKKRKQPESHNDSKASSKVQEISSESKIDEEKSQQNRKRPKLDIEDEPEKLERTLFVGNVDTSVTEKKGRKEFLALFSAFGTVESLRFRSVAFSKLIPRKAAFTTKQLHPERDTLNAYVVFENKESASKALELNSKIFMEKHLRVDSCVKSESRKYDIKRSVFVGNLSFDLPVEDLHAHFHECGDIVNTRIVRDKVTNVGKGFGFVQFSERVSVPLALKLNGTELNKRAIRVTRCDKSLSEKNTKKTQITSTVVEGEHAARHRLKLKATKKTNKLKKPAVTKKKDLKKPARREKGKPRIKKTN